MRWKLAATGLLLVVMWFACWATTVVPELSAMYEQWAVGNALAFFAGIAFGAAACIKRNA